MTKLTFKLSLPQVNENWWRASKPRLTQIVEDYNKENWAAQTDPVDNDKWQARKQPTGSWPILRKTGTMQDSTSFSSTGKMLFQAKVGVNYGGFHQYGTSKMVRRRWLGIGPKIIPEMEKEIAQHVFKKRRTTLRIP